MTCPMPRALLAVIYIYLCAGKIIAQSNYMSLAADQVLDENGVPFLSVRLILSFGILDKLMLPLITFILDFV